MTSLIDLCNARMYRYEYFLMVLLMTGTSCIEDNTTQIDDSPPSSFQPPIKVEVRDYIDHIMEPFMSRDGSTLFFNNLNSPGVDANIHWATRVNDTLFQYQGELDDINTPSLEGVPTMDNNGKFYFVSTRSYSQTLSTLYQANFDQGRLNEIELVEGVSRLKPAWVNFDIEISADGTSLYFVDGQFDDSGVPFTSDIVIAKWQGTSFTRMPNNESILDEINTDQLEYAAAITQDQLEICFTRLAHSTISNNTPRLYVSRRSDIDVPFERPQLIENIEGFVEAATYLPQDDGIYFHRKEANGLHQLYFSPKK